MFGLDSDIGGSALRLWVAAGSAALLVFVCALAIDWTRTRMARVGVVIVGALLGATLAWTFLNGASVRDLGVERRALEARAAELNVQALGPALPLACLDGLAGDSVEAACERALFATPATVAAATTYVAAQLALLADIAAYTKHGGGDIDGALLPLRRGLETDRFGFVAQTLVARDGCSSSKCTALALLQDPGRVRANLNGDTFGRYLDHYVTAWAQSPSAPVADVAPPVGSVAAQTAIAAPARKSALNIDFPSADSIPAISIMNPEPKGGTPTPAAAQAAVAAGQQSSAKVAGQMQMPPMPPMPGASSASQTASGKDAAAGKSKRKQTANAPAQAAVAPPAAPVDPVWNPGATLASPQGGVAAPAPQPAASAAAPPPGAAPANAASSGVPLAGMPVQITPFAAPQGQ
jgi:hypothetical protein